ncbi:MAG: hypothetical protein NTY15_20600 [Planctomycetota bacterium]|nr:hypothetical protein [Planctomycetota bacterium]
MIVQYLSEYIAAKSGDEKKIAEFVDRYGYTPKPCLREGLNDYRYYQLSNRHPNEESRYEAAVRLLAVVFHEPKVTPPRGKQREVVKQWLLWLSRRQEFEGMEELVDLCRRATGVESVDLINSIIGQTPELANWQRAGVAVTESNSHLDSIEAENAARAIAAKTIKDTVVTPEVAAVPNATDFELLENFKNSESYRAASPQDKKAMKKAFAAMSYEERVMYFEVY